MNSYLKTRDGSLTFECRVNLLGFTHTMIMRVKKKKEKSNKECVDKMSKTRKVLNIYRSKGKNKKMCR
jgi:preprotein translocase subunit YajC